MSKTLFAGMGGLIGAIIMPLIKILTPDGSECIRFLPSFLSSTPWLEGFIRCMFGEVIPGVVIFGAIGTLIGALIGD